MFDPMASNFLFRNSRLLRFDKLEMIQELAFRTCDWHHDKATRFEQALPLKHIETSFLGMFSGLSH